MNTFIQVATQFEAVCIIRKLALQRTRLRGLSHCYQNHTKTVMLWISGIGQRSLVHSFHNLLEQNKPELSNTRWINIGIAASLNPEIPAGSLFQISTLLNGMNLSDTRFQLSKISSGSNVLNFANLVTVAEIINSPDYVDHTDKSLPMLVDMEAFHLAQCVARYSAHGSPNISCLKIVSDHADGSKIDFHDLAQRYDPTVENLLEILELTDSK